MEEHLSFGSLADNEPFTEHERWKILTQCLTALQYLHSIDIIHRNLKLENILVSVRETYVFQIKISDFGLAEIGIRGSFKSEQDGGALSFTAPEFYPVRGKPITTSAIDIWSLSVVMVALKHGLPQPLSSGRVWCRNLVKWNSIRRGDRIAHFLSKYMLIMKPKIRLSAQDCLQHVIDRPKPPFGTLWKEAQEDLQSQVCTVPAFPRGLLHSVASQLTFTQPSSSMLEQPNQPLSEDIQLAGDNLPSHSNAAPMTSGPSTSMAKQHPANTGCNTCSDTGPSTSKAQQYPANNGCNTGCGGDQSRYMAQQCPGCPSNTGGSAAGRSRREVQQSPEYAQCPQYDRGKVIPTQAAVPKNELSMPPPPRRSARVGPAQAALPKNKLSTPPPQRRSARVASSTSGRHEESAARRTQHCLRTPKTKK